MSSSPDIFNSFTLVELAMAQSDPADAVLALLPHHGDDLGELEWCPETGMQALIEWARRLSCPKERFTVWATAKSVPERPGRLPWRRARPAYSTCVERDGGPAYAFHNVSFTSGKSVVFANTHDVVSLGYPPGGGKLLVMEYNHNVAPPRGLNIATGTFHLIAMHTARSSWYPIARRTNLRQAYAALAYHQRQRFGEVVSPRLRKYFAA